MLLFLHWGCRETKAFLFKTFLSRKLNRNSPLSIFFPFEKLGTRSKCLSPWLSAFYSFSSPNLFIMSMVNYWCGQFTSGEPLGWSCYCVYEDTSLYQPLILYSPDRQLVGRLAFTCQMGQNRTNFKVLLNPGQKIHSLFSFSS